VTLPVSTAEARNRRLDRCASLISSLVPDAITASVILLLVVATAALALGNSAAQVMEAYYRGLWMLLPFTMQMTLIIVLSSAVASTAFFKNAVVRLSALPRTSNQVVALAALLTGAAAYVYWGLGIALAPVIAIYFAREAERKGIAIDFPFLLAIGAGANGVWQFGLSASAPLLMATPGHFLEKSIGILPLSTTIWSPAAIIHEVTFLAALILVGCWLMPKRCRPISMFPESLKVAEAPAVSEPPALTRSEQLERKPYFTLVLAAVLAAWLWHHFRVKQLSLDINSLNTTLLLANFLLHRNFKSFTRALEKAVVSTWPVLVLYHLYAGLAGLIQFTSVGDKLAGMAAVVSNRYTYPLLTASIATVFAFFIPSSGGQWAIQGFITTKSAASVGVSMQRGLLAMSVGDHMGNLTSPFWYVVAAGIARLDFRVFFGYGLVFAALWFVVGVVVFTFAPC
jgi:short-chain fatty acids transporter